MVDPMNSLISLQQALDSGVVHLQPCRVFTDMTIHLDQPNGNYRFTYVILDGKRVQAIAMFAHAEPNAGEHCFQIGYAVSEMDRRRGLGSRVTKQGLHELTNGLRGTAFKSFYVEAVVAKDNHPSNRIATSEISSTPTAIKDHFSGEDALQYLRRIVL